MTGEQAYTEVDGVVAVRAEHCPPSTATERLGWSAADAAKVWDQITWSAKVSRRQLVEFIDQLMRRHREGAALLARHRRRRHR